MVLSKRLANAPRWLVDNTDKSRKQTLPPPPPKGIKIISHGSLQNILQAADHDGVGRGHKQLH
eukprot:2485711-Amphidinium_carterae.1